MIDGLNFSLCTTKLKRNYRNPFPAYSGSLGLLFRWFTSSGPKILPKDEDLSDAFGFAEVINETSDRLLLRSRNDAHPANNWSHVLSNFPTVAAAYQQLAEFPLRKDQVLWIRFTPEESGFNYENLQRWSYHSVHSADAPDLLDKYVKGQEFPVVVIEGVPKMFSWSEAAQEHPNNLKQSRIEMWQARRLVYLAASRTNVFLYFILPPATAVDVAEEFKLMFSELGQHPEQISPSGTLWELHVPKLGDVETLDDYLDAIEAETVEETVSTEPVLAPAASDNKAQTSSVDVTLPPAVAMPVAEPAPPKHEEIKPAEVPVVAQNTPPQPAAAAPNLVMVSVFSLAAEFRMPTRDLINILKMHGFKELSDNTPVSREVASRILRRAIATAPKHPITSQAKTVAFNSLAAQLDGKLQKTAGMPNTPKLNSPKP